MTSIGVGDWFVGRVWMNEWMWWVTSLCCVMSVTAAQPSNQIKWKMKNELLFPFVSIKGI